MGQTIASAGEAFRIDNPIPGILSMIYIGTTLNGAITVSQGDVADILAGDGGTGSGNRSTDELSGGAPVIGGVPLIVNARHTILAGNVVLYIVP